MDFIVKLASGFMNLFTLGGEQFLSWVSGIIPTILMLLVLMNAIIALAGEEAGTRMYRKPGFAVYDFAVCQCIYAW